MPIKFCSSGEYFVVLVWISNKLLYEKLKKTSNLYTLVCLLGQSYMRLLTLPSYSAERCRSSLLNRNYTSMFKGGAAILSWFTPLYITERYGVTLGWRKIQLMYIIATINSHTHGCAMYNRFYCGGDSNSNKMIGPRPYYHIFGWTSYTFD